MGMQHSAFPLVSVCGARPDDQVAALAHDLAGTLQDTRLALAQLRVFLRQREAGYAGELHAHLAGVEASLATNEALLNTFADAARPGGALPPLCLRETDARQFMHAVLGQLRARADSRGVALSLAQPPAMLPPICGDPALLARALLNLVGNAITATGTAHHDGSGAVQVTLASRGPQVQITIRDNGPGIAATAPAGLGLAIARRVLAQHPYGTLTITTPPAGGTTVIVGVATAPLREPQACVVGPQSITRTRCSA